MKLKQSSHTDSIKQLQERLETLNSELEKTTARLQLLEIENETMEVFKENAHKREEEISRLVSDRLEVSHEIIKNRKEIQKLNARAILKIEMVVLPIVVILLTYFLVT